jgi:hypothetical protein
MLKWSTIDCPNKYGTTGRDIVECDLHEVGNAIARMVASGITCHVWPVYAEGVVVGCIIRPDAPIRSVNIALGL